MIVVQKLKSWFGMDEQSIIQDRNIVNIRLLGVLLDIFQIKRYHFKLVFIYFACIDS